MERPESPLISKSFNPFLQAGITLALIVTIMLAAKLIGWTGLMEVDPLFPWTTTTALLLCYSLFNSIFSLSAPNMDKYWGRSILSFLVVAIVAGLLSSWLSNTSLNDAATYKWMFFVIIFGYLVFLSIIRFMKNIVDFAQKEEWNSPKIRKRR